MSVSKLIFPADVHLIIYNFLDANTKEKYKRVSRLFYSIHSLILTYLPHPKLYPLLTRTQALKDISRLNSHFLEHFAYAKNIHKLKFSIAFKHETVYPILKFNNLQSLKLKHVNVPSSGIVILSETLTSLKKLGLTLSKHPFPFEKFTQISKLTCRYATAVDVLAISKLTQLTSLKLRADEVFNKDSCKPLSALIRLTTFHFANKTSNYDFVREEDFPYIKAVKIKDIGLEALSEIPIIQNLKNHRAFIIPTTLHEIRSLTDLELVKLNNFSLKSKLLPYALHVFYTFISNVELESLIVRLFDLGFEANLYIGDLLPFQHAFKHKNFRLAKFFIEKNPHHFDFNKDKTLILLKECNNSLEFLESLIPLFGKKIPFSFVEVYFYLYDFKRIFPPLLLPILYEADDRSNNLFHLLAQENDPDLKKLEFLSFLKVPLHHLNKRNLSPLQVALENANILFIEFYIRWKQEFIYLYVTRFINLLTKEYFIQFAIKNINQFSFIFDLPLDPDLYITEDKEGNIPLKMAQKLELYSILEKMIIQMKNKGYSDQDILRYISPCQEFED